MFLFLFQPPVGELLREKELIYDLWYRRVLCHHIFLGYFEDSWWNYATTSMNDIITEMFRPNVYMVGRQPITTNPLLFDFGTVYKKNICSIFFNHYMRVPLHDLKYQLIYDYKWKR